MSDLVKATRPKPISIRFRPRSRQGATATRPHRGGKGRAVQARSAARVFPDAFRRSWRPRAALQPEGGESTTLSLMQGGARLILTDGRGIASVSQGESVGGRFRWSPRRRRGDLRIASRFMQPTPRRTVGMRVAVPESHRTMQPARNPCLVAQPVKSSALYRSSLVVHGM